VGESALQRAAELFEAALREPPEARRAFVERTAEGDAALAEEVLSLLGHHESSAGFLERPATAALPPAFPLGAAEERTDEGAVLVRTIGRYRVLARLGVGGMGVVYLAEQDSPRRKVALKVLRPGIATPEMLRRFAHEAELLGRLQHPGIARIYEAVATDGRDDAQPFFAMEYVEGPTLVQHAKMRGLDDRERIALLTDVCDAVHHAHQKGVVHRDLKPANVLVDPAGRPRVLDFGVARAIDADVRAATLRTREGEIVGTLLYMSPEQAGGDSARIDTRADVYSLGAVGYELLAGRPPLDLEGRALPEAVRAIRETDPPLLGSVRRELRGDLETVFAKALEKAPERRYASASELAADLRRFLADEPIAARPPSTFYQLRKFAHRNAVLVGSAAVLLVTWTVAGIGAGVLAWRLADERDRAVAAQELAEQERKTAQAALALAERRGLQAREEAALSAAVSGFMSDVLGIADPYVASGEDEVTIADLLAGASRLVDERFADWPVVAASAHSRIGSARFSRGELDLALAEVRRSLELRRGLSEGAPLDFALSLSEVAQVLGERGRTEEARELLRESLAIFDAHGVPDDPGRLTALTNLGAALYGLGEYAEAEVVLREAVELRTDGLGPDHPYTLTSTNNLANVLRKLGRLDEAEPLLRRCMEVQRAWLGPGSPNGIMAIFNYGDLLRELGRTEEAEALFREAIELDARYLPAGHFLGGMHRSRYGELLLDAGRLEEARAELEAGEANLAATLGRAHERTQRAIGALVRLAEAEGDVEEAAAWRAELTPPLD